MEAGCLGCLRQLDHPHGHGTVWHDVSAESALLTDRTGLNPVHYERILCTIC